MEHKWDCDGGTMLHALKKQMAASEEIYRQAYLDRHSFCSCYFKPEGQAWTFQENMDRMLVAIQMIEALKKAGWGTKTSAGEMKSPFFETPLGPMVRAVSPEESSEVIRIDFKNRRRID